MAKGADIIDKAGKKLLKGVPELSQPLEELLPNIQTGNYIINANYKELC